MGGIIAVSDFLNLNLSTLNLYTQPFDTILRLKLFFEKAASIYPLSCHRANLFPQNYRHTMAYLPVSDGSRYNSFNKFLYVVNVKINPML